MVTPVTERKPTPDYSLGRIQDRARTRAVWQVGDSEKDALAIGCDLDCVCDCLLKLTQGHFRESVKYGRSHWQDVYFISFQCPDGFVRDLYVKVSMDRNCALVYLQSFHPKKYI